MKIFKTAVTGMLLLYVFALLAIIGLVAFINVLIFAI